MSIKDVKGHLSRMRQRRKSQSALIPSEKCKHCGSETWYNAFEYGSTNAWYCFTCGQRGRWEWVSDTEYRFTQPESVED